MRVDVVRADLPLKKRFAIAKGSAEVKTNVLAILDGRYGGEAAGSVAYGPSADEMEADLYKGVQALGGLSRITIDDLPAIESLPVRPTARAALIGMAVNHLSGRTNKLPWEILNLEPPSTMKTSFTFGLDDPATTVDQIIQCPYRIVKVKMGNENDSVLVDLLKNVKGREIRVDANGGWSLEQAEEMIDRLARIGVRVVEQPTSEDFVMAWPKLKATHNEIELIVDEGMNTLSDYLKLGAYCDGINVKMAKSGGMLEAIRMARAARRDGKKVMLGCMVESSIGIAQSMYMGSLADYFDLDGPLLLEYDIADGISYNGDIINVERDIIGGPRLRKDAVPIRTTH